MVKMGVCIVLKNKVHHYGTQTIYHDLLRGENENQVKKVYSASVDVSAGNNMIYPTISLIL